MFTTITAWFTGTWAKVLPWLIAVASAVGGLIAIRQQGKDAAYADIAKKQEVQANEALKITQEVSSMPDTSVADKLRQFYRD